MAVLDIIHSVLSLVIYLTDSIG